MKPFTVTINGNCAQAALVVYAVDYYNAMCLVSMILDRDGQIDKYTITEGLPA